MYGICGGSARGLVQCVGIVYVQHVQLYPPRPSCARQFAPDGSRHGMGRVHEDGQGALSLYHDDSFFIRCVEV
jgi:hypothetical protein